MKFLWIVIYNLIYQLEYKQKKEGFEIKKMFQINKMKKLVYFFKMYVF